MSGIKGRIAHQEPLFEGEYPERKPWPSQPLTIGQERTEHEQILLQKQQFQNHPAGFP
jgi:hypothetical protein